MKALYGRYEDVPNAVPDSQAWEKGQGDRTKGTYKTIDDIELKSKKNYEILINNPIKFIKNDILNKAKKEIVVEDSDESESDSSSKNSKISKKEQKQEKIEAYKSPMQRVKESLPIYKYRK